LLSRSFFLCKIFSLIFKQLQIILKIVLKKFANQNKGDIRETRGGTRQGSGAKPKYSEKTTTIAFRVPISKVEEVQEIIKQKQTQWRRK
jgi:hypothetical protein